MKIKEYTIVSSKLAAANDYTPSSRKQSTCGFLEIINNMIKDGWQPYGEYKVVSLNNNNIEQHQVMVLYDDNDDTPK